jgi:mono/diheme cytochrome c family protein
MALTSACSPEQVPHPNAEIVRGKRLFMQYCQSCHGRSGQGDGRLSQELPIAPADLTVLSLLNGGSFPAEAVMTEVYGYPRKYHLGLMPEFGPVLQGPLRPWVGQAGETIMTPQALLDLVGYLETLQH